MLGRTLRVPLILVFLTAAIIPAASADTASGEPRIREEIWGLLTPWPVLAWVVRPLGSGSRTLVLMNHGVSIDPEQRSFFPPIEYRAAAYWFAKRGHVVVSPIRYGGTNLDKPDVGHFSLFFADVGKCDKPNFRGPGLAIAELDQWVIDYMVNEGVAEPDKIIIVGQSGGGWGSIAYSSLNRPAVRAIITFAAGRGGRVDGKPNNNCAPDKLVEAAREFGRTSRVPMLWIYSENDTYFGPDLSKRMHEAFTAAGGNAEYHLLPPFGSDGHFMIDSPDSIPLWAPLVSRFLDEHP
jgi:dienelactone hydrolase